MKLDNRPHAHVGNTWNVPHYPSDLPCRESDHSPACNGHPYPRYPTSAELAAFRRSIDARIDIDTNHYGAYDWEREEGIGIGPHY